MAEEVQDQTSQGQDGTVGADPAGAAAPPVADTADGGQPASEPQDALGAAEAKLAQLEERVHKDGAGFSKKIGELTEANTSQVEALQQAQAENATLRAQLAAARQPSYQSGSDDDGYYDENQSGQQSAQQVAQQAFVDQDVRDYVLRDISPKLSKLDEYIQRQESQRVVSEKRAEVIANFGLSSEQADVVVSAWGKGDEITAMQYVTEAQNLNKMRADAKLRNRQDAMPPVLGGSGAAPNGNNSGGADVADVYERFKSGEMTPDQKATALANNPGLFKRVMSEAQKSPAGSRRTR